jgi:hypothetical protein
MRFRQRSARKSQKYFWGVVRTLAKWKSVFWLKAKIRGVGMAQFHPLRLNKGPANLVQILVEKPVKKG